MPRICGLGLCRMFLAGVKVEGGSDASEDLLHFFVLVLVLLGAGVRWIGEALGGNVGGDSGVDVDIGWRWSR